MRSYVKAATFKLERLDKSQMTRQDREVVQKFPLPNTIVPTLWNEFIVFVVDVIENEVSVDIMGRTIISNTPKNPWYWLTLLDCKPPKLQINILLFSLKQIPYIVFIIYYYMYLYGIFHFEKKNLVSKKRSSTYILNQGS